MGGKRYFLTCYDDFSHHINLYFLASKFDALAGLKEFATMAETQTGRKIKQIRSDGGGEFNSNTAISFYKQKGIEHLLVPPGSHQQNGRVGRVKRVHLTILNLVRTYLTDCKLPPTFWAEAASYAVYVRNRTPCKPSNCIPDDLWYGKKKSHLHLQPFGCKVYYR
jgi:transposase InsO family protein